MGGGVCVAVCVGGGGAYVCSPRFYVNPEIYVFEFLQGCNIVFNFSVLFNWAILSVEVAAQYFTFTVNTFYLVFTLTIKHSKFNKGQFSGCLKIIRSPK